MPRKRIERLIWILLVIGAVLTAGEIGRAQDDSHPPALLENIQTLSPDSSDSSALPSLAIPIDSGTTTIEKAESDSVILEPVLYHPGDDTLLINLYRSVDTGAASRTSPTTALFKSVVFPGWGQYSNRKYIKAGVIFALESYLIYKAVDNGRSASDWHTKWRDAPTELKSVYFSEYSEYRDRRNTFLWYTAVTVFLSMFDAYVDAHLQNFPKEQADKNKMSVDIVPGEEPRLSLRYNF